MSAADSWPAHHTLCKRMQQFSSVAIRGRAPYAPAYEGTQRKRCVCVPMLARLRVQTFMYARRKLFYVFTTTCSLAGVSWSCGFAPQRPPCSRLFHAFDRDQSGRADLELPGPSHDAQQAPIACQHPRAATGAQKADPCHAYRHTAQVCHHARQNAAAPALAQPARL